MAKLISLAVAVWVAWAYGQRLAFWAFGYDQLQFTTWMARILLFPPTFAFLGLVLENVSFSTPAIWNSGLWTTTVVRRLVGWFGDGCIFWVCICLGYPLMGYYWPWVDQLARSISGGTGTVLWSLCIFALFWVPIGFAFAYLMTAGHQHIRVAIGRAMVPVIDLARSRFVGMGGSSRFGGLFDDWSHPHRPGQLRLGASLYSPDWNVGKTDDRHFITIATNRSGKGRSSIIPNLLTWPGSALVIDPKGQNAAVTAAARGHGGGRVMHGMGQAVHVVDPFGELKEAGVDVPVHRFNPLAELDPMQPDIVERIGSITEALVVPDGSGGDSSFWDNASKSLIAGAIAFILTHPATPPGERNLRSVRKLLQSIGDEPVRALLRKNRGAGNLAASAAATLDQLDERARGSVIGTALTHTNWLDSSVMADVMEVSDFTLADLKVKPTTIYLVIPPQYLDEHGRFLRLFVNLSLHAVSRGRKQQHSVLFVLDEFYALGRMQLVAKAAGLLAGYGVKLWPIVQNLGQIEELYPDNWETFLGQAGMWQVFAVNDQTTARYLSERLGHHIVWRKINTGQETEWTPQGAAYLRTPVELARQTSRDSGNQVVFVEGGDSFLLRRQPYDQTFRLDQYSPDPFEAPLTEWQTIRTVYRYDRPAARRLLLEYFANNTELGRWIDRKGLRIGGRWGIMKAPVPVTELPDASSPSS